MAELGEINVTVGATGADINFQYQISPPADWFGEVNCEGSAPVVEVFRYRSLAGETNAEGFIPEIQTGEDRSPATGYANAQGFAASIAGADAQALLGTVNAQGFAATTEFDYRPSVGIVNFTGYPPVEGQVGIINITVGATGAAVETVNFIVPPADWFGTTNIEGFVPAFGGVANALTGTVNAQGFAPEVIADYLPSVGEVNVEGFAAGVATDDTYNQLLGTVNIQGFAASIDSTLTTIFSVLGEVITYREGETATIESILEIAGPDVGVAHAVGFAPSTIETTDALLGEVNAEGFAASVTFGARIIAPEVGIVRAEGFAAIGDTVLEVVAQVGIARAEGFNGDVLPSGGDFITATTGDSEAVGLAATIDIQRTGRAQVGILNASGFASIVGSGAQVVSIVGYTNVNGLQPEVGFTGWQPIRRINQTWTPANEASSNWSSVSQVSSTWTEIKEAS